MGKTEGLCVTCENNGDCELQNRNHEEGVTVHCCTGYAQQPVQPAKVYNPLDNTILIEGVRYKVEDIEGTSPPCKDCLYWKKDNTEVCNVCVECLSGRQRVGGCLE